MPGPSVDIGRDLVFFADPQTSFKVIATDYTVAADAIRSITASVNGKSPFAMFEDKRGTSTPLGIINQKRTGEFSMECYAYVTTRGTEPDWADMMTSGGWQLQANRSAFNTTVTGGTTTVPALTSVTNGATLAVGDAIIIETGSGTDEYEIRRVTNISALNVTVTPALQNTPASGANVYGAIIYKPKDAKDTVPDALTLWAGNNRSMERMIGGVVGTSTLSMGGDEAARMTFSGTGRQVNLLSSTTITESGGINAAVTSFDIGDGLAVPQDVSATSPVYFQADDEVFKVIGISGDTVTVDTRQVYIGGGAAASHSEDAEFFPHQATGSYSGSPIPATSGQLVVDGEQLQAGTISIDIDHGIIYRENIHGDEYSVDGYVGGMRAVTATLDGWSFFDSTMTQALGARSRDSVSVHCQQGVAEDAILAVELPSYHFEEPDMDRGGDEVTVSLTGQAVGTAAETEIYLMVG